MKEDLNLTGNDLNYLTTYWIIEYIIGQITSRPILLEIQPSIRLPTLELIGRFLVIGMAGMKNVKTLYALRFSVGLLEASALFRTGERDPSCSALPRFIAVIVSWF